MAKKVILVEDIESSLLDTIVFSELWWKPQKDYVITEEDIECTDDNYAEYKELCKEYPGDYMEITLTDEEYNRIVKYKQETLELDLILRNIWENNKH
ncbi:MAG: hypothetical protein H8E16_04275 [Flavobacteriales bacterium]|nr:hypothetical protein [Flavobacteriales bacterium]